MHPQLDYVYNKDLATKVFVPSSIVQHYPKLMHNFHLVQPRSAMQTNNNTILSFQTQRKTFLSINNTSIQLIHDTAKPDQYCNQRTRLFSGFSSRYLCDKSRTNSLFMDDYYMIYNDILYATENLFPKLMSLFHFTTPNNCSEEELTQLIFKKTNMGRKKKEKKI